MAVRVTGEEVKAIFLTDLTASELAPFISAANVLINSYDDLLALSDELLLEIERWLSAHYASARDQRISYQDFDGSKASFQGKYSYSLKGNDYGQMALSLDPTGTLEDLSSNIRTATIDIEAVNYPCTYATSDCDE